MIIKSCRPALGAELVARGRRKAEMADAETPPPEGLPEQVDPEAPSAAMAAWTRLIKNVYLPVA